MSTTKSSLEAQLFQVQKEIDNLSVEKEAFVEEQTVLKKEIVDLHDKLAIATAEVSMSWYCSLYVHVNYYRLSCTKKTLRMSGKIGKRLTILKKR